MSQPERPTEWPAKVNTPYGEMTVPEREYVDLERQGLVRDAESEPPARPAERTAGTTGVPSQRTGKDEK